MNLEFSTEICQAIENYEDDTRTELYMLRELYDSTHDETFKENIEEICRRGNVPCMLRGVRNKNIF